MKCKSLIAILATVVAAFSALTFVGCETTGGGESAYETWLEAGHEGTEEEFLEWLKGEAGENGTNGTNGQDGK